MPRDGSGGELKGMGWGGLCWGVGWGEHNPTNCVTLFLGGSPPTFVGFKGASKGNPKLVWRVLNKRQPHLFGGRGVSFVFVFVFFPELGGGQDFEMLCCCFLGGFCFLRVGGEGAVSFLRAALVQHKLGDYPQRKSFGGFRTSVCKCKKACAERDVQSWFHQGQYRS